MTPPGTTKDLAEYEDVAVRGADEADQKLEGQRQQDCKKCQMPKPPRAHHCSICRRCVLKMDHHCK